MKKAKVKEDMKAMMEVDEPEKVDNAGEEMFDGIPKKHKKGKLAKPNC